MQKKKNKNKVKYPKSAEQFRVSWSGFSSTVWKICAISLIVAMLLSSAFIVIMFFVPKPETQDFTQEIQQYLQEHSAELTQGIPATVIPTP
jgi:hypothetical protein